MYQSLKLNFAIILIVLAAGCASTSSEPTLADAMRGHSDEAQQEAELKRDLAQRWERGNKLEATGRKRVERAREQIKESERKIVEARDAIERGNVEIAEGRELKSESERRFRASFPDAALEPIGQNID